jgi:hypothetical protein
MGLLSQKTDLKSLKYGRDRFNGGSSGQPYVKTPIAPSDTTPVFPFGPEALIGQTGGVDQLTRGGSLVPTKLSDDVQRISKFLISNQGITFLAKQQGLYLSEQIQLYGLDYSKWKEFYNPLSPITNTALAPTGKHLANILYVGQKPSDNIPREGKYREGKTFKIKPTNFDSIQNQEDRVDKITAKPLSREKDEDLQDTVPFRIVKIDNSGNGNNTYINFRAYIEGLSDSYKADWGSFKYMGRGENFYFYNGFDREISFKFQVPVLSKYEQKQVFAKLNYLASLCAPDYSQGGFMRGNIIKLTIGDYLIDVPGIFQGVSYAVSDDAGWDIARGDNGNKIGINEGDTGGYVMPRLIDVSGFTFKPIHNFIPKTVDENYVNTKNGSYVDAPFISYGKLSGGTDNEGGYSYFRPQ